MFKIPAFALTWSVDADAGEQKANLLGCESMPELRSCRVSYQNGDGIRHSVEVTAETLYEAAVLGMTALRAGGWINAPNLTIEVTVKAPETTHSLSNAVLAAWLSRAGKSPREQALKSRLLELMRNGSTGTPAIESGAETLRRR